MYGARLLLVSARTNKRLQEQTKAIIRIIIRIIISPPRLVAHSLVSRCHARQHVLSLEHKTARVIIGTQDSTCYHWNTRQHVLSLPHRSTCDHCHRRQHVLSSNHRSRYQIIDHVIKSLVRKTARVITRPQSRPLARCWRVVLHAPRARRCACVPSMKKGIECAYCCLSSYAHNCPCAHVRMADGRTVVLCSNRRTVVLCSNGRTIGAPATQQATQAKCAVASLRHQQRGQELYVRHPSGPNPRGQPQQERDRG